MTTRERVMLFIYDYKNERSISPSVREICEGVGIQSPSTIHGHLHRLKNLGLVDFMEMSPRSLSITDVGLAYVKKLKY